MSEQEYIPGVCNIGRARLTAQADRLGGARGDGRAVGCVHRVAGAAAWRLVLFFPAMIAAIGFLQAAWHFCAKFGLEGVFNFGPQVGRTDTVDEAEYRRQDRRTAWQIIGLSVLAGAVVAAAAYSRRSEFRRFLIAALPRRGGCQRQHGRGPTSGTAEERTIISNGAGTPVMKSPRKVPVAASNFLMMPVEVARRRAFRRRPTGPRSTCPAESGRRAAYQPG